jgi:signal transduction histidine kinase
VGFDPDVATMLFERFEQADGSITRRFGGTGLGLAISKALVEQMNGKIYFKTSPTGTSFFIDLPVTVTASSHDDSERTTVVLAGLR